MADEHSYKGRIKDYNHQTINFMPEDNEFKGLSVYITYSFSFPHSDQEALFENELKRRLTAKQSDSEGIKAEVCINQLLSRDNSTYKGIGPIRFLDDK